jgi:hypothetical protein
MCVRKTDRDREKEKSMIALKDDYVLTLFSLIYLASPGYRDVADVVALAKTSGLELRERVDMPANNNLLVFACA